MFVCVFVAPVSAVELHEKIEELQSKVFSLEKLNTLLKNKAIFIFFVLLKVLIKS